MLDLETYLIDVVRILHFESDGLTNRSSLHIGRHDSRDDFIPSLAVAHAV